MKENKRKEIKTKGKGNNGGLTLVELLVSIAILAVVSSAIFAFMLTGSRFFNRHSAEADMQEEAQIMKNYLDDLIRDTGRGLDYRDETMRGYKGADRCLIVYGRDTVAFLGWVQAESQVHFLEKKVAEDVVQNGDSYELTFTEEENNAANWPVLSDYVTEFKVSLEKLTEEHQLFVCDMAFSLRQREMETAHTITLRNQIINSGRLEEVYEGLENIHRTLDIRLIPLQAEAQPGEKVQYHAALIGTGVVSQDVVYSVAGNSSAATRMDGNGLLTVGADEEASVLFVSAAAASDSSVRRTVTLNVLRVTGVRVTILTASPRPDGSYPPDFPILLRADVEGMLGQGSREVTWSVAEDSEVQATDFTWTSNGIYCTVAFTEAVEPNSIIRMKATSALDTTVFGKGSIRVAEIPKGELVITSKTGEFKLKRNGSLDLDAYVKDRETKPEEYTWEIVGVRQTGGVWGSGATKVSIDKATGVLSDSMTPDFKTSYEIEVRATWKQGTLDATSNTCIITMDVVHIVFIPEYAIVVPGLTVEVTVLVEGIVLDKDVTMSIVPHDQSLKIDTSYENTIMTLTITQEKNNADGKKERLNVVITQGNKESILKDEKTAIYRDPNITVNNTKRYAPAPGQEFLPATNGIPNTDIEVELDGVTYGYRKIPLHNAIYEYYVEKSVNPGAASWFLRATMGNFTQDYIYNGSQYVEKL